MYLLHMSTDHARYASINLKLIESLCLTLFELQNVIKKYNRLEYDTSSTLLNQVCAWLSVPIYNIFVTIKRQSWSIKLHLFTYNLQHVVFSCFSCNQACKKVTRQSMA